MPRQSVKFSLEFKEELETALRKEKKKKNSRLQTVVLNKS